MSVETEIEKVETEVKEETAKIVNEVKAAVKETFVRLTAEEKLALRELEVSFLKAQAQYTQLEKHLKEISTTFQSKVDEYTKKYFIDKAEYVFDGVALEFRKITQDIKKEL